MRLKTLTSILGIQLTRNRLAAVEFRARGTVLVLEHTLDVPLENDPLTADMELAGREILSHLERAGIRARKCVVCLPVEPLLVQTVNLTGVAEGDVDSLLALEAERTFPVSPEDLLLASSRYEDSSGTPYATLAAIDARAVERIAQVVRKARLHLISVTPGPPAFLEDGGTADAALVADGGTLTLAVRMTRGVALLRPFAGVSMPGMESEKDQSKTADYEELGREIRLTLRRLSADVRSSLKQVRVFGFPSSSSPLAQTIERELKEVGLGTVVAGINESGEIVAGEAGVSLPTITRVAAQRISGRLPFLEFWRTQEPGWRSSLRRLMARGTLVRLGLAAGLLAVLLAGAFSFQALRLASLEHRWKSMQPDVDRLTTIREGIRLRRPWVDMNPDRLEILRALTTAFPEAASAWVRSVEIRESNTVDCLGFARSNRDCLGVLEALRTTPGVADLQIDQVRGDRPVQFSFQYKWQKERGE